MPSGYTVTITGGGMLPMIDNLQHALDKGLTAAAAVIADSCVQNFMTEGGGVLGSASRIDVVTGEKRGRKRLKGKPKWIPAPPGAFPGVRLSHLRNSIVFAGPELTGVRGTALVGTTLAYGRHLEFGTRKMAARPWLPRSALMVQDKARLVFLRAIIKHLQANAGRR